MPGFKFELSQLVNVPGHNQQGRVSARMEYVAANSIYQVSWLDEALQTEFQTFDENELIEAQRKPADSTLTVKLRADTAEAEKSIDGAALKVAALHKETRATLDTLAKLPRNVFNATRKRSRSKRKSKR